MSHQEPILLQCYLSREGDEKNRLILYPSKVQVIHKGKSTVQDWDKVQVLQLQSKKLIIALVGGGIGTSLSMLAMSLGWYNYNLNLFAIFGFFTLMYWGFVGQKALVMAEQKHQDVFLLKDLHPRVRSVLKRFYQRKRNLLHRPKSYIFHITYQEDWDGQSFESSYRHASLEQEGFIHASVAEELVKSYQLYFDPTKAVVLLAIDPDQLEEKVEWEYVQTREANFPHVMGAINKTAIHSAIVFNGEESLQGLLVG